MARKETTFEVVRMIDVAENLRIKASVSDPVKHTYHLMRLHLIGMQLAEESEITLTEWDALFMQFHSRQVAKKAA